MSETEAARTQPVVLIVDDDASVRMLAGAAIQAMGMIALEAENGEEALRIVDQTQPDLIVLDIMMPGLTGFETCQRIRELPNGQHVPVLIVTGRDFGELGLEVEEVVEIRALDAVAVEPRAGVGRTVFGGC